MTAPSIPVFNIDDYKRPKAEALFVRLLAAQLPGVLVTSDPKPDDPLIRVVLDIVTLRSVDGLFRCNVIANSSHIDRASAESLSSKVHALIEWLHDTCAHIEGLGYVGARAEVFPPRRASSEAGLYSYTSSTRVTLQV